MDKKHHKKIVEAREAAGIGIGTMALKLGMATMEYSFYEEGLMDTPNDVLEKIALICEVDISVFNEEQVI